MILRVAIMDDTAPRLCPISAYAIYQTLGLSVSMCQATMISHASLHLRVTFAAHVPGGEIHGGYALFLEQGALDSITLSSARTRAQRPLVRELRWICVAGSLIILEA